MQRLKVAMSWVTRSRGPAQRSRSSPDHPSCLDPAPGLGHPLDCLQPRTPRGGAASSGRMSEECRGYLSASGGSAEYPSPVTPRAQRSVAVSAGCEPLFRLVSCQHDPVPEHEFCVLKSLRCGEQPVELGAQFACRGYSKLCSSCCSRGPHSCPWPTQAYFLLSTR